MLIVSKHTLQLFQRLRQIDQSLAKILQTHGCLKEIVLAFASSRQNRRLQLLFYPSPILLLQIGYILSEMILQYLHVLQLRILQIALVPWLKGSRSLNLSYGGSVS